MPQSSTVSHLVFARARTGKSEQLGERLLGLIEPSRNAEGCLSFDLKHSLQDPDLWLISGSWVNEHAMIHWLTAPELEVFSEVVQAFMVSSLDFHTFATADEVHAQADHLMHAV